MRRQISLLLIAASFFTTKSALADEAVLEQIYGDGVHAFYAGDYTSAYNALTSAIKGGSQDPRAYYFRGLTYLHLGRDDEAKSDFEKGAELEVGDSGNFYPVNRSLERIQGEQRQLLEHYRLTVHAVAVEKQAAARQARYEERSAAEQQILRHVAPAQLNPGSTADLMPATTPPSDVGAPATQNAEPKSLPDASGNQIETAPQTAPKSAPVQIEHPAGTDAPAKAMDNSADPFGEASPAQEKPKPAAATPPQKMKAENDAADPFGGPDPTPIAQPKPTSAAMPATANPNDAGAGAAAQPTKGVIGSLFHAVNAGLKSDAPQSPPGENPMGGVGDFVKGLMQGSAAAPTGNNAPAQNPGTQPATPAATNNPNNAAPPADDLFGQPTTNPATPAQPAPQPAAQQAQGAPAAPPQAAPPATQTPPANNNDDPFK